LKGDLKWKIPVIVILMLICGWFLLPSTIYQITTQTIENFQQSDMPEADLTKLGNLENSEFDSKKVLRAELEQEGIGGDSVDAIVEQAATRQSPIVLGLDLQGGVHLVLEVEADEYVKTELTRLKDILASELEKKGMAFDSMVVEDANILRITTATPEDSQKIGDYIDAEITSLERKGTQLPNSTALKVGFDADVANRWKESAIDQALLTIRNRVDEFGLTEPVIQRQGKNRIIVELAGEKDPQRAVRIIGKTAALRFQLVKDFALTKEALLSKYDNVVPEGYEVLPGGEREDSTDPAGFYLVEKEAKVTGANLQDARVSNDELGMPAVSFELDRDGARSFAVISEENIGNALAIVLDGTVQTAPVFRSRIPDGQGQITGIGTYEEANDTAIVLRAGALPAPVKILQNTLVGPTLGEDSIKAGRNAILIGGIIVICFMLVWYKASGVVADVALLFNLFFVLGILAYFKATLTLPGLAGIALTVGMAVDANVLIFERIKEEMRRGKTLRSSVENGFSRANLTILDANLTTLLAAVVLFQFGTGPIKGFAVTLCIGILSTLFTALILSKVLFDLILQSGKVKRLSI
jgi:preprotein translocase subunit SecD